MNLSKLVTVLDEGKICPLEPFQCQSFRRQCSITRNLPNSWQLLIQSTVAGAGNSRRGPQLRTFASAGCEGSIISDQIYVLRIRLRWQGQSGSFCARFTARRSHIQTKKSSSGWLRPVCLGSIDLKRTYYLGIGVRVIHTLLMS